MAAYTVPPYPGYSGDPVGSTHIECLECGIEWGWSAAVSSAYERLDRMADDHNVEVHGWKRVRE